MGQKQTTLKNEGDTVQLQLGDGHELEMVLQWTPCLGASAVDLDACAVCLGGNGQVVDAAFYNQLSACDHAVTHSGDNRTGKGDGDDEIIKVDVEKLPGRGSCTIVLCVFAHKGGTLQNIEGGKVVLRGKAKGSKQFSELASFYIAGISGDDSITGAIVAAVYSNDQGKTWFAKRLGSPCPGLNFQEGKEEIRKYAFEAGVVCSPPPGRVSMEKTFFMEKADVVEIPLSLLGEGEDVFVAAGWTCSEPLDIDISVIVKTREGKEETIVYFKNKNYGECIKHSGDNRTGEGEGDDEKISIDLDGMPSHIESLWVVVNIYSKGRSFAEVTDSYVRLCASKTGHTLAQYELDGTVSSEGVIFCKLKSAGPKTWYMEALGLPTEGKTARHATTKRICGIGLPTEGERPLKRARTRP